MSLRCNYPYQLKDHQLMHLGEFDISVFKEENTREAKQGTIMSRTLCRFYKNIFDARTMEKSNRGAKQGTEWLSCFHAAVMYGPSKIALD